MIQPLGYMLMMITDFHIPIQYDSWKSIFLSVFWILFSVEIYRYYYDTEFAIYIYYKLDSQTHKNISWLCTSAFHLIRWWLPCWAPQLETAGTSAFFFFFNILLISSPCGPAPYWIYQETLLWELLSYIITLTEEFLFFWYWHHSSGTVRSWGF